MRRRAYVLSRGAFFELAVFLLCIIGYILHAAERFHHPWGREWHNPEHIDAEGAESQAE